MAGTRRDTGRTVLDTGTEPAPIRQTVTIATTRCEMAIAGIDERIEITRSYDGTRIATASWGEPGQPTVIFSNGICCSDTYWTFLQPALTDAGYRVIFFDYRGHKRSGSPGNPNEVTLPSHAQDLWCVADHHGVDEAVLIGHSMGVQSVLEAYRKAPERVVGLALLAGPFEYPLDHLYMTPLGALMLDALELTWKYAPAFIRTVWQVSGLDTKIMVVGSELMGAISRRAPRELVREYFDNLAALDPILVTKMFRGMQMHSARDMLSTCDVPILQIAGGRDMLTPLPYQREMATLLPNVRFEVYEKASHTLPIDEPERLNKRILGFLAEVYGTENTIKAPTPLRSTDRTRAKAKKSPAVRAAAE